MPKRPNRVKGATQTVTSAATGAVDDLRDGAASAVKATQDLYGSLPDRKQLSKRARMREQQLRRTVSSASAAIGQAADSARTQVADKVAPAPKRTSRGRGPLVLVLLGVVALFNPVTGPGTRNWIKDRIFGPEEEFEYVPGRDAGWPTSG